MGSIYKCVDYAAGEYFPFKRAPSAFVCWGVCGTAVGKIEVYNGKDLLSDDVYEIVGYGIYSKNGYRKSNEKYHYNKKNVRFLMTLSYNI